MRRIIETVPWYHYDRKVVKLSTTPKLGKRSWSRSSKIKIKMISFYKKRGPFSHQSTLDYPYVLGCRRVLFTDLTFFWTMTRLLGLSSHKMVVVWMSIIFPIGGATGTGITYHAIPDFGKST
jgi:hypothetical protein